jgi:hypothetical protein
MLLKVVFLANMVLSWDLPAKVYFLDTDTEVYLENFASGSFPTGWATSGNADWLIAANTKFGSSALGAQSGDISDSQSSILTYTGDCQVWNFTMFISSENTFEKTKFYVDGVQVGTSLVNSAFVQDRSGVVSTSGEHTFTWVYEKDFSTSANDDTAYLKEFTCTKLLEYTSPDYDTNEVMSFELNAPLNGVGVYETRVMSANDHFTLDIYPQLISPAIWDTETTVTATPSGGAASSYPFGVYLVNDANPFFEPTLPAITSVDVVESWGSWGGADQVIMTSPCVAGP